MQAINENDFDSPGYEYLRTYQNMSNLYYKLIALNYQTDFCAIYKCPLIHRYYFSIPSKNVAEQKFLFACLSAWLIKDKCQMNLELEPEEYEDPDVVIGVIFEALRLLVSPDDEIGSKRDNKNSIGFSPARLKDGFGPEVIWTMNVLADRALELMFEANDTNKIKIVYHNKSSAGFGDNSRNQQPGGAANSITIGQPFVGGGLTTRPLGSYQIDDANLLFDKDSDESDDYVRKANLVAQDQLIIEHIVPAEEWYNQVAKSVQFLESARLIDAESGSDNWQEFCDSLEDSNGKIQAFLNSSKPILDAIINRIDRQMQVLNGREKFIQSNLKTQIAEFLGIWRHYSLESNRNKDLLGQVDARTDKFESLNGKLREINGQIELRIKELNDGSKLKDLETLISQMRGEDAEFKLKIGLLLTVYCKIQHKIVSTSIEQHKS